MGKQTYFLEYITNFASQGYGILLSDVDASYLDTACAWFNQSIYQFEGSAFAAAGGTEQDKELTLLHDQVEISQGVCQSAVVTFRNGRKLYHLRPYVRQERLRGVCKCVRLASIDSIPGLSMLNFHEAIGRKLY